MTVKNLMLFLFLFACMHSAKSKSLSPDSLKHKPDEHDHHKNEIGIAQSPVIFIKEKEISYGLHVHYMHFLHHTAFGIGVGYERIFDAHRHNTFGLIVCYCPVDKLSFILSPGITFEDAEVFRPTFALHAETAYEFEIKNFHLGPALEFAYDAEDLHISLGLHIGIGF